jgi:hypothetical protein
LEIASKPIRPEAQDLVQDLGEDIPTAAGQVLQIEQDRNGAANHNFQEPTR